MKSPRRTSPVSEERWDGGGVSSATGSFGLGSASRSRVRSSGSRRSRSPSRSWRKQAASFRQPTSSKAADVLENDAEVMSELQPENFLLASRRHPGGRPQHQHRRAAPRASGSTARQPPRLTRRCRRRVPHDPPARPTAGSLRRECQLHGGTARLRCRGHVDHHFDVLRALLERGGPLLSRHPA